MSSRLKLKGENGMFNRKQQNTIPRAGRLPASRRAAVALALACAGLAAVILTIAISGYKHSQTTHTQQETVLVASGPIQKGSTYAEIEAAGLVKSTPVLATKLAPGAVTNASTLVGRDAATNIVGGQQLTQADFASASNLGVGVQLAHNQRAIQVAVDSEHGLSAALATGDYVDVYGSFEVTDGGSQTVPIVKLLVANARILRDTGSAAGTGTQGGEVVLAVADPQAPIVALSADQGKIWLVLRPANGSKPSWQLTNSETVLGQGLSPSTVLHDVLGSSSGSAG
jgi:Flp pilus assembly protein CpaB